MAKIINKAKWQFKGTIKKTELSHLSPSRFSDPNLKRATNKHYIYLKEWRRIGHKFGDFMNTMKGITKEKNVKK